MCRQDASSRNMGCIIILFITLKRTQPVTGEQGVGRASKYQPFLPRPLPRLRSWCPRTPRACEGHGAGLQSSELRELSPQPARAEGCRSKPIATLLPPGERDRQLLPRTRRRRQVRAGAGSARPAHEALPTDAGSPQQKDDTRATQPDRSAHSSGGFCSNGPHWAASSEPTSRLPRPLRAWKALATSHALSALR